MDYIVYHRAINTLLVLGSKSKKAKEDTQFCKEEIEFLNPWVEENFSIKERKILQEYIEMEKRLCLIGFDAEYDLTQD